MPNYTVIGERERFDDQPIYYLLIDPVDVSTDEFKNSVKGVLQALAAKQGNPNFSAWFYDNREIGRLAYDDQVTPPVMDSPEEIKAKASAREPHLIASYSGGNPNAWMMYGISWFPGATTSSPTIGQWVDSEEFKP